MRHLFWLALLAWPGLAWAQTGVVVNYANPGGPSNYVTVSPANPLPVSGTSTVSGSVTVGAPHHLVSSTLTTPTGVTYTGATSAAPLAVCANASVTICAPITVTISATQVNAGWITRVVLQKSTTGATAAQFRVLAFQTAPTLTSVYDTTAYTVVAADVLSAAWVGAWECTQANANLETFECFPDSPIGYNAFAVSGGTLYFVVEAIAAYVRATGETFNVLADLNAQVP